MVILDENAIENSPPSLVKPTPEVSPISLLRFIDLSMAAAPVIPTAALTSISLSIPTLINSIATLIASFFDNNRETISLLLFSMIVPFSAFIRVANSLTISQFRWKIST